MWIGQPDRRCPSFAAQKLDGRVGRLLEFGHTRSTIGLEDQWAALPIYQSERTQQ